MARVAVIAGRPRGRRDLDHGIRTVDLGPEFLSLLLGLGGLVCEARIDFDGDTAIDVVGGLGDRLEDIAGIAHVGGGELADGGLDIDLAEFLELCVVRADLAQSRSGDGRVGGDANNVIVLDELFEISRLNAGAGQVIQPDGNAGIGNCLSRCSHYVSPNLCC
mgnify:CR=1 FL=1